MKIELKNTIILFSVLYLVAIFPVQSQTIERGDSLFIAEKYTEAFEDYNKIFESGFFTPAMLLKMAFIKEGLGDHTLSLYFLEAYYQQTGDREALIKMSEIASNDQYQGYAINDFQFFESNLIKYGHYLQLTLSTVILIMLILLLRTKKGDLSLVGLSAVLFICLTALLLTTNDFIGSSQAIIYEPATLMSGPSGASEPIERIGQGHKVEIIDRSTVWTEIEWNGQRSFIRNSKLLPL